jgi:Stigma-specific protein, Stig1
MHKSDTFGDFGQPCPQPRRYVRRMLNKSTLLPHSIVLLAATIGISVFACSDTPANPTTTEDSGAEDVTPVKDATPATTCAAPRTVCGGSCVDTLKDLDNCGGCNNACKTGEVCTQGVCATACGGVSTKCAIGGKDTCVNTTSDNENCGSCNKKCAAGSVCSAGKCEITCTSGYSVCGGPARPAVDAGMSDAAPDAARDGAADAADATADGAADAARDAATDAAVDASVADAGPAPLYCAKLVEDPLNCGSCGTRCDIGQKCTEGLCCAPSKTACGGACVDTTDDAKNCGACGKVCGAATPYCSASTCVDRRIFTGIVKDEAVATLTNGWTECFKQTYGTGGATVASMLAACTKSNVMVACRRTGSATMTVAAQAPRTDAFFDVGNASEARREANGASWYFSGGASFGFAPTGEPITRLSCDTASSRAQERMCVHTSNGNIDGGWSCGSARGLNGDNGWERIIYHAD